MAGYEAIVGHVDIINNLKAAVAADRVSHAYLIEGAKGSGKTMLAEAFAAALLCEQGGESACGTCSACRRAAGHNHPDIIYVTHEKPELISVDEVRTQITSDVLIRPYEGRRKIYIVKDAQMMNTAAQNALLKTLEEPPAYAVILLLTLNAEQFLDTIRSRAVTLSLRPVSDALVETYLMNTLELPDYQAKLCAAFAQGSIGRAVDLAGSENFRAVRSLVTGLVRRAADMDVTQMLAYVKELGKYKLEIRDYLDLLQIWYRDVLYFKATQDPGRIVFQEEVRQVRSAAVSSSYEGLEAILKALDTARVRLDANVSFDLTMELLFLTIKENS